VFGKSEKKTFAYTMLRLLLGKGS